jgi:hypothetical protein
MTVAAVDRDAELLGWTGLLRQEWQRLNSWHFGGRLTNPTIEFARLEPGTTADYGRPNGIPAMRFSLATIEGVPFLSREFGTSLRRVRLLETTRHELCHQAADELYGYPPTGDQDLDHGNYGFRLACATIGIPASTCAAAWTYREWPCP